MDKTELLNAIAEHAETEEGRQEIFDILNPKPRGVRSFYFGCWRESGHYIFTETGNTISYSKRHESGIPWADLDCVLCPQGPQKEGLASMHYKNGWTALAFWDRSLDSRPGSNSVFIAEGMYDLKGMIELSQKRFPTIWRRFKFEIKLAPEHYNKGIISVD